MKKKDETCGRKQILSPRTVRRVIKLCKNSPMLLKDKLNKK